MKNAILILLMISSLHLFGQEEKYQSGIIVLTDGRIIAMRGDFERVGDEILFLDDRSERVSLPAKMVDFKVTAEQNKKIREKAKDKSNIVDDGSLYSKVMRDKEQSESSEKAESQAASQKKETLTNKELATKRKSKTGPIIEIPESSSGRGFPEFGQFTSTAEETFEDMQEQLPVSVNTLVSLLVTLSILLLISFITELYLIFTSYHDSTMWGLAITFFTLGGFLVPLLVSLVFGVSGNMMVFGSINGFFFLGKIVVILSYMVLVFPGNRLRIFLFWSMPVWFSIFAGIILGLMIIL